MRGVSLALQYIYGALFVALGVRAVLLWQRQRDRRSAHLAFAAGAFGLSQLMSTISTTVFTPSCTSPPAVYTHISGTLSMVAILGFLLFLGDFIEFPAWARIIAITWALANIVMTWLVKPEYYYDHDLVRNNCVVDNAISFNVYLASIVAFYIGAFLLLAVSFFRFGRRLDGLARFRMSLIGWGFVAILIAIVIIPPLLLADEVSLVLVALLQSFVLVSAPLLFLGFTPPSWLTRRFGAGAGSAA